MQRWLWYFSGVLVLGGLLWWTTNTGPRAERLRLDGMKQQQRIEARARLERERGCVVALYELERTRALSRDTARYESRVLERIVRACSWTMRDTLDEMRRIRAQRE